MSQTIFETHQRRLHVQHIMRRRLASRTRGMLEITNSGRVEYPHRTAKDWIKPHKWPTILATSSRNPSRPGIARPDILCIIQPATQLAYVPIISFR
ncbi:hypothetical protein QBC36DRAFT_319183 [Triangularia setosa]|uniref:Uncharacterized protein n=1 Tax=Triangularia setosa TaxID=2587417 RepID=A0AAN6WFF0_9PEZI|nr:hypothetical protein QBC36DRAFT_319183 [Podospora setosa]